MKSIFLICLLALCSANANAAITFDEVATQPADGLLVEGVTFGFSIGGSSATDAIFNSELPVASTYLDDRVLSGPVTGLLSFQFAIPVFSFQFGLLLNTFDAEQPAAIVYLYDENSQSLGSVPLDSNPLVLFSEGLFTYSGPTVSRAEIAFSGTTAADLFAIDNLDFQADATDIPEPSTTLLIAIGLLSATAFARARPSR